MVGAGRVMLLIMMELVLGAATGAVADRTVTRPSAAIVIGRLLMMPCTIVDRSPTWPSLTPVISEARSLRVCEAMFELIEMRRLCG